MNNAWCGCLNKDKKFHFRSVYCWILELFYLHKIGIGVNVKSKLANNEYLNSINRFPMNWLVHILHISLSLKHPSIMIICSKRVSIKQSVFILMMVSHAIWISLMVLIRVQIGCIVYILFNVPFWKNTNYLLVLRRL